MVYTVMPRTKGVKAAAGIDFSNVLSFSSKVLPCLVILPQQYRYRYT